MTNRNPDIAYRQLHQVLRFAFEQMCKDLHTLIPGIVRKYDPSTKRASVQIALNMLVGDPENYKSMARPVIPNVPVIHPSAGGFTLNLPIQIGDAVVLGFSERGIENFKTSFAVSDPTLEAFHAERDAVAFPGFGALEITPVQGGLSIQKNDGSQYILLNENGDITVQTTGTITLRGNSIRIEGTSDTLVVS